MGDENQLCHGEVNTLPGVMLQTGCFFPVTSNAGTTIGQVSAAAEEWCRR